MISNLSQIIAVAPKVADAASAVRATPSVDVATVHTESSGSAQGGATTVQSPSESQTLSNAIEKLNSRIQNLNRNLQFSLDKDSGELLVKVIDAQTHKVIRQIPSEEALALAQNIDKYLQDHHLGLVQTKA